LRQPPGGWRPQERVSLPQAIDGFTRWAAYAGFAEDRIGSLDPGNWADFILVDRDPTKVDAQSLGRTEVLETRIGRVRPAKSPSGTQSSAWSDPTSAASSINGVRLSCPAR
jgi:cytosine/adenosine deaminase-related metal-dependent hydrolase